MLKNVQLRYCPRVLLASELLKFSTELAETEESILGVPVSACTDDALMAKSVATSARLIDFIIKFLLIKLKLKLKSILALFSNHLDRYYRINRFFSL
jgi:hypothetical protein